MSENQHGLLDAAGCHVFTVTLDNSLHYLRIVCVTISVDTFLASHWSDQAKMALLLARGSEVQTSNHATNNNTIINPTLTLKLDKKCVHQAPKNDAKIHDEDIYNFLVSDSFQF